MEEKIKEELKEIERRMQFEQKQLEEDLESFRADAALRTENSWSDSNRIITVLPAKINMISETRERLQKLAAQKEVLEHLLK